MNVEQDSVEESLQEVPLQLPVYQSTQARSVNLNELIRLHRIRQKYQIVDSSFNNSYISIENKLQPIQIYYQYDMFRSYLEDLNLVYFKDIEFAQNVRLQYVLRRLNFTLNGETYNFREFLIQNKFDREVYSLFSQQYLQELNNNSNQTKALDLRNTLNLCLIVKQLFSCGFTEDQFIQISSKIKTIYRDIKDTINPIQQICEVQEEQEIININFPIKSATNQSQKSNQRGDQQQNESHLLNYLKDHIQNTIHNEENHSEQTTNVLNDINYSMDDMLYEEQIRLKIMQTELQSFFFINQMSDTNTNEEQILKLKYLFQMNIQIIRNLNQLLTLNRNNRKIVKKIQKNLKIELNTGVKCIVIHDSDDINNCFGELRKVQMVEQQKILKYQKISDTQCMQSLLFSMINKLKMRQIADTIEKVNQIQKDQIRSNKFGTGLAFSLSFQKGLGINEAIIGEKDFIILNQLREESTLTSYLTPMKSRYSYISHNIYTFLKLNENDFPYDKFTNNDEEVMKKIKNKISRHRNLGKTELKDFYVFNFKICHNCKILCHKNFLKQCKRRIKHQRQRQNGDDEQVDDDSLYTQKNFRSKKHSSQYAVQCEKNYCIYCIKNQFNGKIFNDKGWCPSCLDCCHCNTCLRQKMVKKLIDLYCYIGGDPLNIKTEKQMIQNMKLSFEEDANQQMSEQQVSIDYLQTDDKIYESAIKRQIMKGYSAQEIGFSLRHQKEIIGLIKNRQNIKYKNLMVQKELFREKLGLYSDMCKYYDHEMVFDKQKLQQERKVKREKQREQYEQKNRQRMIKMRPLLNRYEEKRKCRKILREQEVYYDYYKIDNSDSYSQSSSFHIKQKKSREKQYQPQYTF